MNRYLYLGNGFHLGEESASLYLEVWYFLRAIHFTSSSHMAPVILFPEIIILLGEYHTKIITRLTSLSKRSASHTEKTLGMWNQELEVPLPDVKISQSKYIHL